MSEPLVIVGGGLAGGKAAKTLRDEGFDGPVVLVAAEAERPYERPPLSKGYLLGKEERGVIYVNDAGWYDEQDVDLRTGVRAVGLDPAAHRLELDAGEALGYGGLLLATGAEPRRLNVPGAELSGQYYLRTAEDSDRLKEAIAGGERHVVVIGSGWIGLETAAAARTYGNEVTIIEPQPTPLYGVLGPAMGEVFARLHRDHGVQLHLGRALRECGGTGAVDSVVLDDGTRLPADLVVIGVGVVPDTALAAAGGLAVDNGVVTDAALRTSAPDVFAAGDVANAFHPMYGRGVRVEHWANALNQGPAAARSMLGQQVSYDRVPYFFSDQYELGMEYSGLAGPDATVVTRGKPEDGEFIAFWLEDGKVRAGMNVNVWDVTDPIQTLIRADRPVDVSRLADPDVELDQVLG